MVPPFKPTTDDDIDGYQSPANKIRYDRHRNPIKKTIGKYDPGQVKNGKLENGSENSSSINTEEKKRHRVTFVDEVAGNQKVPYDLQYIESYKHHYNMRLNPENNRH